MTTDFTKIRWAGQECILVTIREHAREPVLILDGHDIELLNKCWNGEAYQNPIIKDKKAKVSGTDKTGGKG